MQLEIIDISSWQHPNGEAIDWQKVAAAGYHGVLIKATQGTWYVNPFFADDVDGAHAAGLTVGAYHFAEPGRSDAQTQALHFHTAIAGKELELGVWLDLEQMGGLLIHDLQAWSEGWLAAIDTPQVPAGMYMNLDYANQLAQLAQSHRLWLANPSNIQNSLQPIVVQTGQGTVDGIVGACDIDVAPNARAINPPGGGGVPVPPPPAPPEPAPAPPAEPVLQQGATGLAVEQVQEDLNRHGTSLAVDGNFGPLTHEAVVEFQQSNGLAPDGIVGPLTWAALASATSHPDQVPPGAEGTLQEGNAGPAVTLLQRLLNEQGAGLAVDGQYGPNTRGAVTEFQLRHGLQPDGVAGPVTWAALRSAT